MKLRIIEKPSGIFKIETFKCLKEFGRMGFWYNIISYTEPLNEMNYYHSLHDAENDVLKLIEHIKNPVEHEKVIREYFV